MDIIYIVLQNGEKIEIPIEQGYITIGIEMYSKNLFLEHMVLIDGLIKILNLESYD